MPPEHVRAAVATLTREALAAERWFGAKDAAVADVELAGALGPFDAEWLLALRVGGQAYLLPAAVHDERLEPADGPLWQALARACLEGAALPGDGLELTGRPGPAGAVRLDPGVRPLGIDQSNTSMVLGERLVLKCYRRLTPGPHPEIELTRHLAARGLACVPAVRGSATVTVAGETAGALLLQDYIADGRDGWLAAEEELGALIDRGEAGASSAAAAVWAPAVGEATADLHALLATADGEGFRPRRAEPAEAAALAERAQRELDEALSVLDEPVRGELAAAALALGRRFAAFTRSEPPLLMRVHGDLHLGQFLRRDGGTPMLVDFEGEPTKTAAERRRRSSPLRDLAGLLRSVDHAAHWVCSDRSEIVGPVAAAWISAVRGGIRAAYERRLAERDAPFTVDDGLLAGFEAEKAVYEFVYAARFLPSWLTVPRRALASAL